MFRLEHGETSKERAAKNAHRVDALRDAQDRHKDDFAVSQLLRTRFRVLLLCARPFPSALHCYCLVLALSPCCFLLPFACCLLLPVLFTCSAPRCSLLVVPCTHAVCVVVQNKKKEITALKTEAAEKSTFPSFCV